MDCMHVTNTVESVKLPFNADAKGYVYTVGLHLRKLVHTNLPWQRLNLDLWDCKLALS